MRGTSRRLGRGHEDVAAGRFEQKGVCCLRQAVDSGVETRHPRVHDMRRFGLGGRAGRVHADQTRIPAPAGCLIKIVAFPTHEYLVVDHADALLGFQQERRMGRMAGTPAAQFKDPMDKV
jgi:hypothetical protein